MDLLLSKKPEGISLYSEKYTRTICNGLLARFNSILNYNKPEEIKLNIPIALVRPTIQVFSESSEDYDLSTLVNKQSSKIPVTVLEGDHYTILENLSLPNLVNEFFS